MNVCQFLRTILTLGIGVCAAHAATERVSVGDDDRQKIGASTFPSISADGRLVAFASTARLHPSDTNNRSDVYVRDRVAKTTRLVSDDRGGDQPVISANGRFVAFRAFDDLPRVRVVDLEGTDGPVTVSYPFDGNQSERPADAPSISADGRYIAFIFRAAPFNQAQKGALIVVHDTQEPNRFAASETIYDSDVPLGRVSLSANGDLIAFDEPTDAPGDPLPNGGSDVFIINRLNGGAVRLSVPGGGIPDLGGSHSPAITPDGTSVFFIAGSQLRAGDTDGRASIYRATIGNPTATPFLANLASLTTSVAPLALEPGAFGAGFLAYVAKPTNGFQRPIVQRLSDGLEKVIVGGANGEIARPAISADGRILAFNTSASNLVFGDTNGARDVFVFDLPDAPAARTPPTVNFNAPPATLQSEFASFTLNASATDAVGTVKLTTIDFDGVQVAADDDANVVRALSGISRGIYTARASAFNDVWLEGRTAPLSLIVRPPNGVLGITGATALDRTAGPDGTTAFTGSLRLDNRRAGTTGLLQLVITEAPATATMSGFGDQNFDGGEPETVLQVIDLAAMTANTNVSVEIAGIVSAPTVKADDPLTGTGWTAVARLREKVGANFNSQDTRELFSVRPRLSEETPGPNGGVVELEGARTDDTFNPAVLQSISIVGPNAVPEFTRTQFRALANYSNGTKPAAAAWSITGAPPGTSTSSAGVLTAGNVSANKTVTLTAQFGGQSATKSVIIRPVLPVVSVRVLDKVCAEPADAGSFKILRSTALNEPLDVAYEITGKALAGDDYVATTGVVTIPTGANSALVDITPIDDPPFQFFEGLESVIIRLLPASTYRVGSAKTATLIIADDEPMRPGMPDLLVRFAPKPAVGAFVFDNVSPSSQVVGTACALNQRRVFTTTLVNRDSVPRTYTILGGENFEGFTVQYLAGTTDITAAVVAGTHKVTALEAGKSAVITVRITATVATGVGTKIRNHLRAQCDATFEVDVVQMQVERVK